MILPPLLLHSVLSPTFIHPAGIEHGASDKADGICLWKAEREEILADGPGLGLLAYRCTFCRYSDWFQAG